MRVIATVIGPLKKHVGMYQHCGLTPIHGITKKAFFAFKYNKNLPGKTVMISQLDGYDGLPIDSQVILQAVIFYGLPLAAKQIY